MTNLDYVADLILRDSGLAVVTTLRPDRSIAASVVNAGVLPPGDRRARRCLRLRRRRAMAGLAPVRRHDHHRAPGRMEMGRRRGLTPTWSGRSTTSTVSQPASQRHRSSSSSGYRPISESFDRWRVSTSSVKGRWSRSAGRTPLRNAPRTAGSHPPRPLRSLSQRTAYTSSSTGTVHGRRPLSPRELRPSSPNHASHRTLPSVHYRVGVLPRAISAADRAGTRCHP